MSKIIKVSTDLEVTVHDFPQGNMREQNRALYELIGNGCDMIEHVMPVRLYNELGHSNHVKRSNSKCVSMLIDEEGLLKDNETNPDRQLFVQELTSMASGLLGTCFCYGCTRATGSASQALSRRHLKSCMNN